MKTLRYFYHPDHLGSSSWITDGSGNAIQHLHYLPFGEDWVDQRTTSWNAPYTFSGKEKDVETGYGYFGARYYDSGLSIWLSVDPMSDKYPSLSPYNYCANNPVILVDPDGRDWYESEDGSVLSYIHGKIDEMEGYKHIGTTLGQEQKDAFNRGDYSTLNISANFKEDDFVTQMGSDGKSKMSCAAAANAMCIQRGGDRTSYANEFPMVTEGANGRAGDGIQSNLFSAIVDVSNSLLQGIPVVGGVDYKNDSPNKKTSGGDGMTDHYIAITGVSLSLSKGDGGQVKITGGSFQYANPGNFSFVQGLSSKNILNFNSNGWKASNSKYILTTMRVK